MKKSIYLVAVALIVSVAFSSCNKKSVSMKSENDSLSYALGINLGNMFKENIAQIPGGKNKMDSVVKGFKDGLSQTQQSYTISLSYASNLTSQFEKMTEGQKINKEMVMKAFEAALKGDSTVAMRPEAATMFLKTYVPKSKKLDAAKELEANTKFLTVNKTQPGVVTTASGLQYKVITEGKGPKPTLTDNVKVAYRGTTVDGKEFDKNAGISFPITGVIKGWTEGLQLMSVGSKYMLFIPYQLGYGEQGNQAIKPFSTLIFEVELLAIEKPTAAPAPATAPAKK